MICRLSRLSTRPSTFTLVQPHSEPEQWREAIRLAKAGNRQGSDVHPQVTCRPTGVVFSLGSYHPFMAKPSYLALAGLAPAERAEALRDPALKAKILAEINVAPEHIGSMEALIPNVPFPMHQTFPLTTNSSYEPLPDESFEARAQAAGLPDGSSALYDYLVGGDGRDFAIAFFTGYATYTLDGLRELQLDDTMVGDVTPLSKTRQLEMLSIQNTRIADLGPLRGLTKLKKLYIAGSLVKDISPVQGIPGLKIFQVAN